MRFTIKRSAYVATACFLLLLSAACSRVQPVYAVQDHVMPTQAQNRTPDQVSAAIVEAAQSAGWQVEPLGPGEMRATQKWREHSAIVRISYTGKAYSIRNDGSSNLMATGDLIHREYNLRVRKLESTIEQRLQQG